LRLTAEMTDLGFTVKLPDGHLAKDGALLLEFGINQAEAVAGIFADYDTRIIKDMAGIERIAIVKRKI